MAGEQVLPLTIMRMSLRTVFILVAAILSTLVMPVSAQFSGFGRPASEQQQQQRERVSAELVSYEGDAVAGDSAILGVVLDIQENWKIQAGAGSGDEVPPYLATEITLTLPDGWQASAMRWPAAKSFEMGVEGFTESLRGYEGRLVVATKLLIPSTAEPGEYDVEATIEYQACDDKQCEMQTSITASGTIVVVADAADATPAELDPELAALFVETLERAQPAEGASDTAAAPQQFSGSTFFGLSVPRMEGVVGLIVLALLSAIGGFILNLTPCVLPVIPIKIMTLQQHANKPGKNMMLGLWMFAGVVAFWVAIGLPVAFLTGVTDPSQLFGIWWVTFGIGAIIALMGVGIMGMFSIQLPQSVYAVNPKADTAWGSFVFGVMTAVLGLPCFGFVAGALLAGAATLPPSAIMIIFTSLGVGMALPYLVLSAKPSLVEKLPRTGPASELVKQVMGLLLIAAAAYFIGSGLIALVSEQPHLARELHWWAVALFASIAGLWLVVRTFQITSRPGPRVAFTVIALLVGGFAVVYAANSTARAKANLESGTWTYYTPAAFETARSEDNIVVLDFTAEWCLICKALKASILDREPVRSQLEADGVVNMTVDLTSRTAEGWDFLRELGQTGIPLLVIYTPGKDEPWQGNSYTAQQVLTALDEARNGQVEALAQRN